MQKQRSPGQKGPSSGAAPSQNTAAAGAALRARNALTNLDDTIQKLAQPPKVKRRRRICKECGKYDCDIGPFRYETYEV